MGNLLQTLLHPDREDEPERAEVARAANLLQIGEFQLLQLAYHDWFGAEMGTRVSDAVFRSYMVHSQVPPWARHYARRIIVKAELGDLDDSDPVYHRYDCDYYRALPLGARRLVLAVMCIAVVVAGGILVGHFSPPAVTSVLPPYFSEDEIDADRNRAPGPPDGQRGP